MKYPKSLNPCPSVADVGPCLVLSGLIVLFHVSIVFLKFWLLQNAKIIPGSISRKVDFLALFGAIFRSVPGVRRIWGHKKVFHFLINKNFPFHSISKY